MYICDFHQSLEQTRINDANKGQEKRWRQWVYRLLRIHIKSNNSESIEDQTSTTKLKKLKVAPLNYDNAILVIKFDDTSFDYSTALFESISNALEQIPSAAFEVVAVSPTSGPTYAENARDRASEVFSKIVEMGVPTERVSITSSTSTSAQAEEVHIYLKN